MVPYLHLPRKLNGSKTTTEVFTASSITMYDMDNEDIDVKKTRANEKYRSLQIVIAEQIS